MRALITGSRGFLGQHLVRELLQRPEVTSIIGVCRSNKKTPCHHRDKVQDREYREVFCDIEDECQVGMMMHSYQPDIIFHLAANPLVALREEDPLGKGLWRTNVDGTHNLLVHAPPNSRFVLASSAAIYGDLGKFYRCWELEMPRPSSLYGASKLSAEGLVHAYNDLGKIRGVILRYVANVGIGSTHGIVHDFIRKLRAGYKYLEVIGDAPGSTKPYVYVKDTVKATVLLGFSSLGGVWNVSTDNSISVEEVAVATMQAIGIDKPIKWLGQEANWPGDNRMVSVSNIKLKKLGWKPRFSLSTEAVRNAVREVAGMASH